MHWIESQLLVFAVGLALLVRLLRPVSRRRVERFARRQALEVTVANGAVVIEYLAATRRWRVAGFVGGLLISFALNFTQRGSGGVGVSALVGWFAGALVAEWRSESQREAPARRSALLIARRLHEYVPRSLLQLAALVWVTAIALGTGVLLRPGPVEYSVVVDLGVVVLVTPATLLMARRIVARPQALVAEDVLAADDALRSRSLHVLVGCTLAVNGFVAAAIESAAQHRYDNWLPSSWAMVVQLVAAGALPIFGFLAATQPFAARRLPVPRAGAHA